MKVPINEGDGSINIQELEQNLLGDANWIPRLNTLVLAEINNNLRAIAQQLEESESRKIMRDIRDNVNGHSEKIDISKIKGFTADKNGVIEVRGAKRRVAVTEQRPWGGFEVLAEGEGYKVKRIWVNPGEAISLQSHKLREEVWTIVRGYGAFNESSFPFNTGDVIEIAREEKHRMTNRGNEVLEFIEVQTGECREDDIIRYEDKYGRVEEKK